MNNLFFDFDLFVVPEPKQNAKIHRGEGKRGILVVYEPIEEELELTTFLGKVLQAAKIDMSQDIFLVPIRQEEGFSFRSFCRGKDVKEIISFGIPPEKLGLHLNYKHYLPLIFNQRTFLFTDALYAIFEERQLGGKKMSGALWKALKTMFLP